MKARFTVKQGETFGFALRWTEVERAATEPTFHSNVQTRIERLVGKPIRSVKRSASGSPATGSAKAHAMEQQTLLTLAFTT